MSLRLFIFTLLLAVGCVLGRAETPVSDPKGVDILTQSLNAAGAANPLNLIQDFTAAGTITYFWAGEQVQAPATIRARGSDQFRLDASLASGTRSVAISRDSGARKDAEGRRTDIPLHNRISKGGSSFPYPAIAAALAGHRIHGFVRRLGRVWWRATAPGANGEEFPSRAGPGGHSFKAFPNGLLRECKDQPGGQSCRFYPPH